MITLTPESFEIFLKTGLGLSILLMLSLWSVIWKGLALWRASKLRQKKWFVVLLVVNTVGILEILYLSVFSKKKQSSNIS